MYAPNFLEDTVWESQNVEFAAYSAGGPITHQNDAAPMYGFDRPMIGQCNAGTEREQRCSGDVGIVRFCLIFQRASFAHNGLVGGSSPPGPTNGFYALHPAAAIAARRRLPTTPTEEDEPWPSSRTR